MKGLAISLVALVGALGAGCAKGEVEDAEGMVPSHGGAPPATPTTPGNAAGTPPPPGTGGAGAGGQRPPNEALDGGSAAPCPLALEPISFPAFAPLPAGAKLRVRGLWQRTDAPITSVAFSARRKEAPAGAPPAAVAPVAGEAFVADIELREPGAYELTASARRGETDICGVIVEARAEAGPLGLYVVRAAAGVNHAAQALPFALPTKEGQPTLTFRAGEVAAPALATATDALASFLRVFSDGVPIFNGSTKDRSLRLLPDRSYDALFIPDSPVVAPLFLRAAAASTLARPVIVDDGLRAPGLIAGESGPLEDVSVLLRAGLLTSTVARTDAGGAFDLRVRAGAFALEVVPPRDSGLPDAHVPGLVFAADGATRVAEFRFRRHASARLSVTVRLGGAAPPAGTRVNLALAPVDDVGTLTFSDGVRSASMHQARGELRLSRVTDAAGQVVLPKLPHGRFTVTVVPPDGVDQAVTTRTVMLVGDADVEIPLAAKVTVGGRITGGAAGWVVTARDRTGDLPRAAVSAPVAADGTFALPLEEGRLYLLTAAPDPKRGTLGGVLLRAAYSARAEFMPDVALPPLTSVTVQLLEAGGGVSPQGLNLQLHCAAISASCVAPDVPLGELITSSSGLLEITVPTPTL